MARLLFVPLFVAILASSTMPRLEAAQTPSQCHSCGAAITGKFFWFKSPALKGQRALCQGCSQHKQKCFECQQPAVKDSRKLSDGRFLCREHAPTAILTDRRAVQEFERTKRQLFPMLNGLGKLTESNVRIQLADRKQLDKLYPPSAQDERGELHTLGLTRTTQRGSGPMEHEIWILSGLSPSRFAAVASHEYTHVWLHENLPPNRKVEQDTVEAFCELVAFRLMDKLGHEEEKAVIMQNAYTRGQIKTLVDAQDEYRFFNVARWMMTGAGKDLAKGNTSSVLDVKKNRPAPVTWAPVVQTKVPDELMLKGISGNRKRRFALINNKTLMEQERARVRVGSREVVVKCLEIKDQSVRIQVQGEAKPRELRLSTKL